MEIEAAYHSIDAKRLTEDSRARREPTSVFVPFGDAPLDGPGRYFSLDFDSAGGFHWSIVADHSTGVRVPVNRLRPKDNAGVAGLASVVWQAREEFMEQHANYKLTEVIGIVFDPADDPKDAIHFGMYVKVR